MTDYLEILKLLYKDASMIIGKIIDYFEFRGPMFTKSWFMKHPNRSTYFYEPLQIVMVILNINGLRFKFYGVWNRYEINGRIYFFR